MKEQHIDWEDDQSWDQEQKKKSSKKEKKKDRLKHSKKDRKKNQKQEQADQPLSPDSPKNRHGKKQGRKAKAEDTSASLPTLQQDTPLDSQLEARKEKLMQYIQSPDYLPMKKKELIALWEGPQEGKEEVEKTIDALLAEGSILTSKKGKILLPRQLKMAVGRFIGNAKGFGFVTLEEEEDSPDVFIPADSVGGAMHGDRVMIRMVKNGNGTRRPEGKVVKILSAGTDHLVGTFEQMKGFGFVTCDDRHIANDIYIPQGATMGAVDGHKVVVRLTKRAEGNRSMEGEVVEILGHVDDPGVDILSIVRQYGLPDAFDEEVLAQTAKAPVTISQAEMESREDLRDWQTVTIDGDDSKDFDDAVSLVILENGHFELGVHIADVTHYVPEGSPLDREALRRGTSYYLVDRVIPMLPHKLSNGICSLNPQEDRLTLSCIMEIDHKGTVLTHRVVKSVIHSHARLTYHKVDLLLHGEDQQLEQEYAALMPMLHDMNKLRLILNRRRQKRGSINFDFPEPKIVLDHQGKVVDIYPSPRNWATNLIEEFMLVANETVAEEFFWKHIPFVYRNHEVPDEEKLTDLKRALRPFGYHLKGQNDVHPKELQALLTQIEGKPEERILSRMVLRSMKQAKYQDQNLGHFGLAAKYYCHFTSPIRRYPDLQIHRIIKEQLDGKLDENRLAHYDAILDGVCRQCSAKERLADEAERETDKLKMVEYMTGHIGEVYTGIISGVTGWGIYVELPNTVEGMVALSGLEDDFYEYQEEQFQVVGRHTKKTYRLGDEVTVQVAKTDVEMRTIDFVFAEDEAENVNEL
ncbi:MAG TPA: ribonuclease R [Firmicutes bacterium]|nr:ribonuclease R [Bacillota bacterium]